MARLQIEAELERFQEFEVIAITDMRFNENEEREFFVTFGATRYSEEEWNDVQQQHGWQAQNVLNYMGYEMINGRRRRVAKVLITWVPDWLGEEQLQGSQRLVNDFLARRRAEEVAAQALLELGGH